MKRELKVFEEEERSFLRAEKKLKKLRNPYSFLYQIKELVKRRGKNLE